MLTLDDIRRIEGEHPAGLTSEEILRLLKRHGMPISEPTLRKYVQLGLLPRCKRVGVKGKHKGSRGIYPVRTIRRIAAIKVLMAQDYTLRDLRMTAFMLESGIDELDASLEQLLSRFSQRLAGDDVSDRRRRALNGELSALRNEADRLTGKLYAMAEAVAEIADKSESGTRTASGAA